MSKITSKILTEPCPFCGSIHTRMSWGTIPHDTDNAVVFCRECQAAGPGKETRDKAIATWNQRATLPSHSDTPLPIAE